MTNLARRLVTQDGDGGRDRRRGRGGVGNGGAEASQADRAPGGDGNGRAETNRSITQSAATNGEILTDGHGTSAPKTRRSRAEEEITEEIMTRRSQRINAHLGNNMQTPAIRSSLSDLFDIDEGDKFNQLALAEYAKDIFGFYRNYERLSCILPNYPSRLRMLYFASAIRTIVFDWFLDIQMGYRMKPQTLFLSMNLLDRIFSVNVVAVSKLKLVAATTILLASKYEDIRSPEVNNLIQFMGGDFTDKHIIAKEEEILDHLDFILSVPTAYFYIPRFLKAAACRNEVMEQLAFYLTELSIRDQSMLVHSPSFLAAAAVYTAFNVLSNRPYWTPLLQAHTGYTALQLSGCALSMVQLHHRAKQANSKIYRKFDTRAFKWVSRLHLEHITRQFFVPRSQ